MANVLVVEDDEQVRVLADSVLEEAGHTVLSASGATSAHTLLESDQPIEILFTDINFGGDLEAGLRLAHFAVQRRPGLRVIYTTGQGVSDGIRASFVEPFQFLGKPYTAPQLTAMIHAALAQSSSAPSKKR